MLKCTEAICFGQATKLLAKALEMNNSKGMAVHVEIHNEAAIHLYESMGFEKIDNQNSVAAHLQKISDS